MYLKTSWMSFVSQSWSASSLCLSSMICIELSSIAWIADEILFVISLADGVRCCDTVGDGFGYSLRNTGII